MCFHLYILKNTLGRHYIGISADTAKRLEMHNAGKVRSTKPYRPWRMVYVENFPDRIEARKREVVLKRNFTARQSIFSLLDK